MLLPIARQFRPALVLISAGFDAARGDPLGGCDLTPRGYGHLCKQLVECGVPDGKVGGDCAKRRVNKRWLVPSNGWRKGFFPVVMATCGHRSGVVAVPSMI